MEGSPLSNNTSTQAGYLTPVAPGPDYDEELERTLNRWVRGITSLPAGNVRPRWTPTQPPLMPADVDWCAAGISGFIGDDNPAFTRQAEDSAELWRHEVTECLASFYGPHSQRIASIFRDGLTLSQNNDQLIAVGLSLGSIGDIIPFPELINNQWVRRYDITVRLRRKVVREYGIKPIAEATVKFFGE
ncbi:hypothetical protein I5P74_05640 [Serratia ureilytica]|nr:hypothetical protein [Serratia ureilytica]